MCRIGSASVAVVNHMCSSSGVALRSEAKNMTIGKSPVSENRWCREATAPGANFLLGAPGQNRAPEYPVASLRFGVATMEESEAWEQR
jgi:hypothetical protein